MIHEATCQFCGEPFTYNRVRGTPQVYCSKNHQNKASAKRQREKNAGLNERWCAQCNKLLPTSSFSGPTAPYCKLHMAKWMREHRKERSPAYTRAERLRGYKMTPEQFDAMFEAQGRRCKICGCTDPGGAGAAGWHVDHDHACCPVRKRSCGKCWRGILCSSCNPGLGNFRDDPVILQAALDYLLAYRARRDAEDHTNPMLETDAAITD